ncbi:hypothetical protein Misp01_38850 [Microtetraspora sp. NBRC 13810]|nr:hypothetical protein Misp01_38850 [Microtetraspora sp. NBRC 13810]
MPGACRGGSWRTRRAPLAAIATECDTVERCSGKLKSHRAVALRTGKRRLIHQGPIDVASIRIWLRTPTP